MELFSGDVEKVRKLDDLIAEKMGYTDVFAVSGQTYTRKLDSQMLFLLSGIAQSAHKFSNDIRLLQNLKEIEEPFAKGQIGSSAMAYKRNPMRSERMASLARYVIADTLNPMMTASEQWFERTLDDSANKRISVPEAFLATDAILNIYLNISDGLVVYDKMIEKHIAAELPFMATENILMDAVLAGGDRQDLHEKIRVYSMQAGEQVKVYGKENDLLTRILNDPSFCLNEQKLKESLDPKKYVGIAPIQTAEYVEFVRESIIAPNKDVLGVTSELSV